MSNANSAWQTALVGQDIGPYRTRALLGGGAFSYVYHAEHVSSGHAVALKVLVPGSSVEAMDEFKTEGELLARLTRASGVVTLRDSGQDTAQVDWNGIKVPLPIHFHALELASACLEELLANRQAVSWIERLRLWRGVILGVHQMHLKMMVHRDLKSSNCLLLVGPRSRTDCKVADLGRSRDLVKPPRHDPFAYLVGLGDLRFAPPEYLWCQGEDTPDAHKAADLYGLGSVLFEVATGLGITQTALGFGPSLVRTNLSAGLAGQSVDLSVFRPRYEQALDVFEPELPRMIQKEGRRLLRQLCSPVPSERWPRHRGRGSSRGDGLEWLIRQSDILIKRLEAGGKSGPSRGKGRVAS